MKHFLFSTNDVVKYLIISGLVYSILKLIPSQQLATKDLIVIMFIIIVGFTSVDCMFFKKHTEDFTNDENPFNLNLNIEEILNNKLIQQQQTQQQTTDVAKLLSNLRNKTTVSETQNQGKSACSLEVEKIKRQFEDEINSLKVQLQVKTTQMPTSNEMLNRYFESLINDVVDKGLLNADDVENIKVKVRSKLMTMEEVIKSLEIIKKEGKPKTQNASGTVNDDRKYNELPSDYFNPIGDKIANEWDNEYTILNTNKWQVPMPRPPVCINTTPCQVCPTDSSSSFVGLKDWDNSRYVTDNKINKKWAQDQANSS
jgi:hypothetical protein